MQGLYSPDKRDNIQKLNHQIPQNLLKFPSKHQEIPYKSKLSNIGENTRRKLNLAERVFHTSPITLKYPNIL